MGSYVKSGICLPVHSWLLFMNVFLEVNGQCLEMLPRALDVLSSFLASCTRVWSQSKGICSRFTKCLPGLKCCPCLIHALEAPSVLLPSLLTENGKCIIVMWGDFWGFSKCLCKLTGLVTPLFLLAMRVRTESILGLYFKAQDVLDGVTFCWRVHSMTYMGSSVFGNTFIQIKRELEF